MGVIAMGLHPVPYYISGFVLLVIFGLRLAHIADYRRQRHQLESGNERRTTS